MLDDISKVFIVMIRQCELNDEAGWFIGSSEMRMKSGNILMIEMNSSRQITRSLEDIIFVIDIITSKSHSKELFDNMQKSTFT